MSEKPCDVCSETHTGYAADPCACSCHAPAPPAPERICEYCGCEFVPEDKHHIAYAEDCICRMALLEKVAAKDAELIACRGAKAAWKARADKAEADNARLRAALFHERWCATCGEDGCSSCSDCTIIEALEGKP